MSHCTWKYGFKAILFYNFFARFTQGLRSICEFLKKIYDRDFFLEIQYADNEKRFGGGLAYK